MNASVGAWRKGLSVAIATSLYGVSFGALSVASGLSILETMLLSALMFSGGSQFALVGVVAAGGTPAAAIATAGVLGIRNTIYAISLRRLIPPTKLTVVPAAWVTIDESTAVSLAGKSERESRIGFWVTGVGIFIGWNLCTLIGAIVGDILGDVRAYGLDAAAAAAFLALLWPRLRHRQAVAVGIASAVLAAVAVPVLPAGIPVLAAVGVAVVVALTNWFGRERAEGVRA